MFSKSHGVDYFLNGPANVVFGPPCWVVRAKAFHGADPPNMVTHSVSVIILGLELSARYIHCESDRFRHGYVGEAASTDVVNLSRSGRLEEMPECVNEVRCMNVVANLLSLISINCIRTTSQNALDEIGQEAVQLGSAV